LFTLSFALAERINEALVAATTIFFAVTVKTVGCARFALSVLFEHAFGALGDAIAVVEVKFVMTLDALFFVFANFTSSQAFHTFSMLFKVVGRTGVDADIIEDDFGVLAFDALSQVFWAAFAAEWL
jgi:hypothetical protein